MLDGLKGERNDEIFQTTHKEESSSGMQSDKTDRDCICNKIFECIPLLDQSLHPEELANVSSGRLSPNVVNVHVG